MTGEPSREALDALVAARRHRASSLMAVQAAERLCAEMAPMVVAPQREEMGSILAGVVEDLLSVPGVDRRSARR